MALVAKHFPAGASIYQALHYAQLVRSGGFRKYNYGLLENLELYGKTSASSYDLTNVKAPIYLMVGRNDLVATPGVSRNNHHALSAILLLRGKIVFRMSRSFTESWKIQK